MSNPCPHKTLVRKNSGGLSWYVCANPDCDAPKVKGNPQKFKVQEWDGQIREVSPAGTGQPRKQPGYWDAEDYRRAADVHETAERIIKRVVPAVLSIAYTRTGLHDVADCDPIDEKEFVDDGLAVALGEDTGCLDPDDLSAENCEVLYVEQELTEILKRAVGDSVKGEGETAAEQQLLDTMRDIIEEGTAGMTLKERIESERKFNDALDRAPAPSPEELARAAENLIDIVNDSLFSFEQKKKHIVAALLRSRIERAERPTLTRFDVYPWLEQSARKSGWNVGRFIQTIEEAGHLEELADTLLAFESRPLPAAPDTEKP